MSKHTPGPWEIGVRYRSSIAIDMSDVNAAPDLATVHFMARGREEAEANARLIAAAPEMLEALEGILAITDRDHAAWNKARAAIAKAKGEA